MAFSLFSNKQKRPDDMLPAGWQFYSRPTNLEPPGTVFRIDSNNTRYIVDRLQPKVDEGAEPGAAKTQSIETKIGMLGRLFGVQAGANIGGGAAKAVQFEITEPVRVSTSDTEIDKVLKPFLATMEFRPKNRYYLIRETRTATAMKFLLSDEQLAEIGGEGVIAAAGQASVKLGAQAKGYAELTQAFPERLGVMFLPEEIAPVSAGLAARGTELGRIPVTSVLEWEEPK